MAISRNSPCPCGSGKKYKKCCFKKDSIQKRIDENSADVTDIIEKDSSVYHLWRAWRKARTVSDFNLLFDLIGDDTPLKKRAGERRAFVEACDAGNAELPSGEPALFRKLRIFESESAELIQLLDTDDSSNPNIRCERLSFRRLEAGWRFSDLEIVELEKSEDLVVGFELFEANPG